MKTALSSTHFNKLISNSGMTDTGIVIDSPFYSVEGVNPGYYLRAMDTDGRYRILNLPCNIRELPLFKDHIYRGNDYAKNTLLDYGFYIPGDNVNEQISKYNDFTHFNYHLFSGENQRYISKSYLRDFTYDVLKIKDIPDIISRNANVFIDNFQTASDVIIGDKAITWKSFNNCFSFNDENKKDFVENRITTKPAKIATGGGILGGILGVFIVNYIWVIILSYFLEPETWFFSLIFSPLIILAAPFMCLFGAMSLSEMLGYLAPILIFVAFCIIRKNNSSSREKALKEEINRIEEKQLQPCINNLENLKTRYMNANTLNSLGENEFNNRLYSLANCNDIHSISVDSINSFDFGMSNVILNCMLYFGFPFVFDTGELYRPINIKESKGTDYIMDFTNYISQASTYLNHMERFVYPTVRINQLEGNDNKLLVLYRYLIEDLRTQTRTDEIKNAIIDLKKQLHQDNLRMMKLIMEFKNEVHNDISSIDWTPMVFVNVSQY